MPIRYVGRQLKRFFVYRVLHVDDTPHRIALGFAIGMFICWTPTIGFQMVLTLAIAALLRANKAVGVPLAWISNPITIPAIFSFNYGVGATLLGLPYDLKEFKKFAKAAMSSDNGWFERLHDLWQAMWSIFWPLWVGSIVAGLVLGVVSYFGVRFAVVRYRKWWHEHHPHPPWAKHEQQEEGPGADSYALLPVI